MANDDTHDDMAKPARHVYGPRAVGSLIPTLTKPVFRRQMPAAAQVIVDWESIVGPALAAVTTPRRLSNGSLTIACSGPIAMELQHMAVELMNRINTHLGARVVHTLRFVQVANRPIPTRAAPPSAEAVAAAEASVAGFPRGELRDALAALGRIVLSARKSSTPASRKP